MSKKHQNYFNKITNWFQEILFVINQFFKETFREFLSKKVIDNFIYYLINSLLLITILYAGYQLINDIKMNFFDLPQKNSFPFILELSEQLFLYFLPIFILFGILNYYDLEWQRLINKTDKPNPSAKNYLNLSKKLFFSSLLSYISLKIVEKLFFDTSVIDHFRMLYIGSFYIVLLIYVLFQQSHD
jgi:hypothetical protein